MSTLERTPRLERSSSRDGGALTHDQRRDRTAQLLEQATRTYEEGERLRLQEEVVLVNMRVAESVARRYRDRGVSDDDLVQVAYLGLVKAVRGFDTSLGSDFLDYAVPTVVGEVKRYFRDLAWAVRPPRSIQDLRRQVYRAADDLTGILHRSPRPAEVAELLGVDEERVIDALTAEGCFVPSSLDSPLREDEPGSLDDLLVEDDNGFLRAETRLALGPAVRHLTARERRIIELRFFRGWTQSEIATDMGLTQAHVSRLLSQVLTRLREELNGDDDPPRRPRCPRRRDERLGSQPRPVARGR